MYLFHPYVYKKVACSYLKDAYFYSFLLIISNKIEATSTLLLFTRMIIY